MKLEPPYDGDAHVECHLSVLRLLEAVNEDMIERTNQLDVRVAQHQGMFMGLEALCIALVMSHPEPEQLKQSLHAAQISMKRQLDKGFMLVDDVSPNAHHITEQFEATISLFNRLINANSL